MFSLYLSHCFFVILYYTCFKYTMSYNSNCLTVIVQVAKYTLCENIHVEKKACLIWNSSISTFFTVKYLLLFWIDRLNLIRWDYVWSSVYTEFWFILSLIFRRGDTPRFALPLLMFKRWFFWKYQYDRYIYICLISSTFWVFFLWVVA
jgi:hypothetical protein